MEALLVIDMQIGVLETPRHDINAIIERINALIAHFRAQSKPIIFVRHNGIKENYLLHGSDEWHVTPALHAREADYYIEKEVNDTFYTGDLEALLHQLHVSKLCICGCATDFCVNATIHGALVRDYNITIASDAHTTADRPMLKAPDIIAFHNWLWENLTPTQSRIEVKNTHEIIR